MDSPEIIKVTRQEVYEHVWSEPFSSACPKYGLSKEALARLCEEWDIPRPPKDYWYKKRNGYQVRRKPLKAIPEGNPVILTYRHMTVEEVEEICKYMDGFDQGKFEERPENRIVVPDLLTDPHPLVQRTARSIRSARADELGRVRPKARGCLDLFVSAGNVERGLLILDTLIKALHSRAYPVSVEGDGQRTQAEVLGEKIGFCLHEEAKRQEGRRSLTGKLVLKITDGQPRSWTDSPSRRVERTLNAIVVGLVYAAEAVKRRRDRVEKQRKEQEEQERRRLEQEQRRREEEQCRKEEEARFSRLEAEVAAWTKAQQIRAYLAALRQAAVAESGQIEPGSGLAKWLQWAEGRANAIDPLLQRPWSL